MIAQCLLTINIERSLCTADEVPRVVKEATNQIHSYFAPLFSKKKVSEERVPESCHNHDI